MVDPRKIKHFVTLARIGNFNEAAEVLHISQPALTRSIQNLEESLDVILIDRSQRAIKLTAAGNHLLSYSQKALMELRNIRAEAARIKGLDAGSLKIGTGPLPADHIGANTCAQFLSLHPNIKVTLVVDEPMKLMEQLVQGNLDVIIVDMRAVTHSPDILFEPLPKLPGATIARTGHPLAGKPALDTAHILQFPLATISPIATQVIGTAMGLNAQQAQDAFSFNCNNTQLMATCLKQSNAIGFLLKANIAADVKRGELTVLDYELVNGRFYNEYGICTYKPRLNSLATDAFIDITKELAKQIVAEQYD
ncbi:LysR family transcriptional regulator [Cellvibrio sp. OA-2007]|uniref:LysR family transcriptional regulator n=1 Tax=Cellvibrio sp. OA-2007 TaxID=529823 RepID=UPI00078099E4|nr:LysR family transcriptional regulator [Cellvibrio sp. OA-2007]